MSPTPIELIGAVLFAIALIHTFSTKYFEHLARTRPAHSGIWHFLGEVEVVFGFWAMELYVKHGGGFRDGVYKYKNYYLRETNYLFVRIHRANLSISIKIVFELTVFSR